MFRISDLKPSGNYMLLPKSFFADLLLLSDKGRISTADLKIILYFQVHEWRKNFTRNDKFQLSFSNLLHGLIINKKQIDSGTGLSYNALKKGLGHLKDTGVLSEKKVARFKKFIFHPEKLFKTNHQKPQRQGEFKVFNGFLELIHEITSPYEILILLYMLSFLTDSNFNRGESFTIDELANGKLSDFGERIDGGIGCEPSSLQRPMQKLLERNLVVFSENEFGRGRIYNLCIEENQNNEAREVTRSVYEAHITKSSKTTPTCKPVSSQFDDGWSYFEIGTSTDVSVAFLGINLNHETSDGINEIQKSNDETRTQNTAIEKCNFETPECNSDPNDCDNEISDNKNEQPRPDHGSELESICETEDCIDESETCRDEPDDCIDDDTNCNSEKIPRKSEEYLINFQDLKQESNPLSKNNSTQNQLVAIAIKEKPEKLLTDLGIFDP